MNKTTNPTATPPETLAGAFAALGQPTRLALMRELLAAHPDGLPAGELQQRLGVPASTLSHHLDKLRHVGLVAMRRDRQWIWYTAGSAMLREMLDFLYAECCTRNPVVDPDVAGRCCG